MYVLEHKKSFVTFVKGKKKRYSFQWETEENKIIEFLEDVLGGGR